MCRRPSPAHTWMRASAVLGRPASDAAATWFNGTVMNMASLTVPVSVSPINPPIRLSRHLLIHLHVLL